MKKILTIFFLFCLVFFISHAQCSSSSGGFSTSDQKLDIEFSINLESDGSYQLEGVIEGKTSQDKLPMAQPIERIKITEGEDYIDVPSPMPKIKIDLKIGSKHIKGTLSLPKNLEITEGEVVTGISTTSAGDMEVPLIADVAFSQATIDELPSVPFLGTSLLKWLSKNQEILDNKLSSILEGKKLEDFGLLSGFISSLRTGRRKEIENIKLKNIGLQSPGFQWDGEHANFGVKSVFSGDIFRKYLFSTYHKVDDIIDNLNNGNINPELENEFRDENYELFDTASVTGIDENKSWKISDKSSIYTIENEKNKLNIYLQKKELDNILPIYARTTWKFKNNKLIWRFKVQNSTKETLRFSFQHVLEGPTEDNNWEVYDNLTAEGQMLEEGDNAVWGLKLLPKVKGFAFRGDLEKDLSEHNVLLELTAPENLNINELPAGYKKTGDNYRWENDAAADALLSLLMIKARESDSVGGMSMLWFVVVVVVVVIASIIFLLWHRNA